MKVSESIVIVSHTMLYGAAHALRDYLLKKRVHTVFFISLPFYEQRIASATSYKKGIIDKEVSVRRASFGVIDYLIDALQVILWIYRRKDKFALFVGINPMNCIIGLFFRKIGKTKKVIFYAIDFTPKRFENSLLNHLYHKLEVYCVIHSDEVWNVSPRIAKGREKFLKLPENKYPQKVVPIGVWNETIKKTPFNKIKRHQLVFLGHLLKKQGVQIVLEAIPFIIQQIPDFKFVILGGGEYQKDLQNLSKELQIEKYVEFKGWVKDREKMNLLLGENAAAVAMYMSEEDNLSNFTYYADPTKIKDYLANGLPVILTDVPYNAGQIQSKKCGIIVSYSKDEVARAVVNLMKDTEKLKNFRLNALEIAKEFEWSNIFDRAFGRL